jgi:hypothetical protein
MYKDKHLRRLTLLTSNNDSCCPLAAGWQRLSGNYKISISGENLY